MRLAAFDKMGVEIKRGDTLLDNRGERAIYQMATRAKSTKSGKVVVIWVGDERKAQREYYDFVFEVEVKEVPE